MHFCLLDAAEQPLEAHRAFDNSLSSFTEAKQLLLATLAANTFGGLDISGEATSSYPRSARARRLGTHLRLMGSNSNLVRIGVLTFTALCHGEHIQLGWSLRLQHPREPNPNWPTFLKDLAVNAWAYDFLPVANLPFRTVSRFSSSGPSPTPASSRLGISSWR